MSCLKGFKVQSAFIDPPVVLAPLAGFTDSPFRRIVKEFSAGLTYTEMVSSMGVYFKDKKTLELLNFEEEERPIAAQIFGHDPDSMAYAAKYVEESGFDILDINVGCPTPKIVNSGAGGALLKNLNLLEAIFVKVKRAVKIPVTIKTRKGFARDENVLSEILKIAEGSGIDAITIHGITVEESFKKNCEDWSSIREIASKARIPIVANGGVAKEEDVEKMFIETGASGVMVGRPVLQRPWFIKSSVEYIEKKSLFDISLEAKMNIILRHAELEMEQKGEERAIIEMRKFVIHYVSGLRNASYVKQKINKIKTYRELESLIRAFFVC